ncbi:TPA: CcmD family protein [Candidatus Poribacteria bacterium]|nr:CcmD family protein [Candidatus Poribacteria bacterium]
MAYFISAYLLIWGFLMGYLFYIFRRVVRLEKRVETLNEIMRGKGE